VLGGLGEQPQSHQGTALLENAVGVEAHDHTEEVPSGVIKLLKDLLRTAEESLAIRSGLHGEVGVPQLANYLPRLDDCPVGEGHDRLVVGRKGRGKEIA